MPVKKVHAIDCAGKGFPIHISVCGLTRFSPDTTHRFPNNQWKRTRDAVDCKTCLQLLKKPRVTKVKYRGRIV